MISLYTIITILFCHWIFDFHLQNDEIAKSKSKSNLALGTHVYLYSIGLLLMTILNFKYFESLHASAFVLINAVLHFFTDWVTSRATSLLYKEERYHDFFCVIGGDQMIHYVTLFGTFVWLTHL
jgi:hypothetical protein